MSASERLVAAGEELPVISEPAAMFHDLTSKVPKMKKVPNFQSSKKLAGKGVLTLAGRSCLLS